MEGNEVRRRVLIGLATYRERENLEKLVPEVVATAPWADVLVVDDNSPDGTADLVRGMIADGLPVHLMLRAGKLGLGTAVLAAMRYAMEHGYEFYINMDADYSHHPRYLPALLAGMDRHDVMIGSRYVPGGGTVNWPYSRWLISRGVNLMTRLLFRYRAKDLSGAFRCYRVSKLREAQLEKVQSRGYSFMQEVLYRCKRAGCRIGETPIVFEERQAGASKVDLWESVRSLALLLSLGVPEFFGLD